MRIGANRPIANDDRAGCSQIDTVRLRVSALSITHLLRAAP